MAAAISSRANTVLDWNQAMIAAMRNETAPPTLASRNLAILHVAIYDAVAGAEPLRRGFFTQTKPENHILAEAAAIAAGFKSAVSLYPSQSARFEELRDREFGNLEHGEAFGAGVSWGERVAERILESRANDGSSTQVPYIPSRQPGAWRRTMPYFRPPEAPHWAKMKPFALKSTDQFRVSGPPSLNTSNYTSDFETVKALGAKNSVTRTTEQTLIAQFWSDFSYTSTPPGHWNEIAAQIASARTNSLLETARLFAMLNVAMADTAIAVWDTKYAYNSWRPVTAIREADRDGNEQTRADAAWEPLLPTPAFPEYVSGHSAFSATAAKVLSAFYGTEHISFSIGSDSVPGVSRKFDSLDGAVQEIGMSRIYGGIHFPSANKDGQALGRNVAEYVVAHCFGD